MQEIRAKLRGLKPRLEERYNVKDLFLFGSYVRGEQEEGSDVDILVEFREAIGLFEFMRLEFELEDELGLKVDLVSKKALKSRIGQHIINEAIEV